MPAARPKHLILPPLLFAAAAVAAWLASPWLVPLVRAYGPPCIIRTLTGFSCPGCGMTRAVLALLQGNWEQAWHYNLFLPFAVCLLAAEYGRHWVYYLKKIPHGGRGEKVWFLFLGLLTCLWVVVRNIFGL